MYHTGNGIQTGHLYKSEGGSTYYLLGNVHLIEYIYR
jgi:hypothetical protein